MDIGKAFVDAWNNYTKNFVVLILAAIVSSIIGILIAPMVGFQMMFVKAIRGEAVSFNDIFAPFRRFGALALAACWITILLMLAFIPGGLCFYLNWNLVGGLLIFAAILLDIYLGVCWLFALLLIYDKGMSINNSLKTSREIVTRNNWWMHFLLVVLAGIVSSLGNVLWGIGAILTMPVGVGAIASAYAEETK
ncbi:MAG: hypothetical protein KKC80_05920 [Candidatus Margulisbacteria bacterium]|nr:hypothetical protein [Candidatus Margulisiibacteriota bacterium]MBU1617612.1 hypothetical protein [Candidatus Margulisiibacteriota bacterium]